MEYNRLQEVGRKEIIRHTQQAEQLTAAAKALLEQAEYHTRQTERWQRHLGMLASQQALDIPQQRPNLTLIRGELVDE